MTDLLRTYGECFAIIFGSLFGLVGSAWAIVHLLALVFPEIHPAI